MSYPGSFSAIDSVRGDIDALASHMRDCEHAQSRWADVRGSLQRAHALTAGRLVTVGCIGLGVALGLLALV